jgi:choline dehydrogenase-like flavoprotein
VGSEGQLSADVIVVGAGSAGAAAARRLVDRGDIRVLLLEAGAPDTNPAIHDPQRTHELWLAQEDWAYYTVPQRHAAGRRLHWPRGRVLGGSSALNGMIWVRGAPIDYDNWAYNGASGWAWEDVRPVFERAEESVELLVDYERQPIHEAIVAACVETGIDFNPNYNGEQLDGVSYMHLTIRDGQRNHTSPAYLGPILDNPNLTVVTGARARRLLLEGSRCVGVEWQRDGQVEQARADAEVIVSAGTIESPPLLMRSGIGPAEHLRSLGIDVAVDLPGVGANLHDHVLSPLIFSTERPIEPPVAGVPQQQTHLWWRSRPGLVAPDVQPIHFSVPLYEPWMEGPPEAFSLMAGMIRPMSRGTIRLSGTSVEDELLIDPQTLACESDLRTLEEAVLLCREIGAAPALRAWGAGELYPGLGVAKHEDLRDWVRKTAITYHHQVGTCKMGIGPDAVVDPELRVHGIDGLRVADASVMPTVPSGNTNAPSIMIGERVSDFFLRVHAPGAAEGAAVSA